MALLWCSIRKATGSLDVTAATILNVVLNLSTWIPRLDPVSPPIFGQVKTLVRLTDQFI